jgi:hypothetical protein
MSRKWLVWLPGLLCAAGAAAQGVSMPPFMGGVPGANQWQAITQQRHLSRTLLYQEALEELRRNPRAAEIGDCPADNAAAAACVPQAFVSAPAAENPPAAPGSRRRPPAAPGSRRRPPAAPGSRRRPPAAAVRCW